MTTPSSPVGYTFWLDYGSEGWAPIDVATLADGFKAMLERGNGAKYRITRPVEVIFVEPCPYLLTAYKAGQW
jgi:hypothetical protein